MVERPSEVNRSKLKNIRSKNFKIPVFSRPRTGAQVQSSYIDTNNKRTTHFNHFASAGACTPRASSGRTFSGCGRRKQQKTTISSGRGKLWGRRSLHALMSVKHPLARAGHAPWWGESDDDRVVLVEVECNGLYT
jgi:hypothetical protein